MGENVAVPFLDVGATYRELQRELDAASSRVMTSGWFLLGPELEAFEREYADYVGAEHAIGVGSGLDALLLSLMALDIGAGDEVIVPSNTYIATWLAVSAVGAIPVPVEPDERSYCISSDAIAAAVGPRTRGILPVHLFGMPADMGPILDIADRAGVAVIADAAQAHGARYMGQPIGGLGKATAWSFYPGKNLGAFADGGAVTTNDSALADRVRRLRNYGSQQKYVNVERGRNSRLDELQAAFLRVKLAHIDEWNARRAKIAQRYAAHLADTTFVLPRQFPDRRSCWHLFVIRTTRRDAVQAHLYNSGVQTLIHYPIPPHQQTAYRDLSDRIGPLPVAERLASEILSLPIGPHLRDDQADHVVNALRDDDMAHAP